ncbi:hypothetical protein [Streptomyces sp. NPDC089799]|uniref:hypothetical protein n=1 Tax=Streptomyces sp. NPDC089799 TaxID=3155066 RepID=UPI00341B55EE
MRAAAGFELALAAGDHAAACRLPAPRTREQVEQDGKQDCRHALASEDLPVAVGPARTEVYGREAMVRTASDTVFLSLFTPGWQVVAAGCTPRPDQPYDCQVAGG